MTLFKLSENNFSRKKKRKKNIYKNDTFQTLVAQGKLGKISAIAEVILNFLSYNVLNSKEKKGSLFLVIMLL